MVGIGLKRASISLAMLGRTDKVFKVKRLAETLAFIGRGTEVRLGGCIAGRLGSTSQTG